MLLTETGSESPYISELGLQYAAAADFGSAPQHVKTPKATEFGELGVAIQAALSRINRWELLRGNLSPDLASLLSALEVSQAPLPVVGHVIKGCSRELCAELAWVTGSSPVAILTGDQARYADEWRARGWKVPTSENSIGSIVKGVKRYTS